MKFITEYLLLKFIVWPSNNEMLEISHSLVLQGVVREDLHSTDVFCGFPGKVQDAWVFRLSPLYEYGETKCNGGHLLGDSAYPNISWLLTPFRDTRNLTEVQKRYNCALVQIHCTVERAFGLLKGRFKCLQFLNQKNIEAINYSILACCDLHNVCI